MLLCTQNILIYKHTQTHTHIYFLGSGLFSNFSELKTDLSEPSNLVVSLFFLAPLISPRTKYTL